MVARGRQTHHEGRSEGKITSIIFLTIDWHSLIFLVIFTKGANFCDFVMKLFHNGLTLKRKNLLPWQLILTLELTTTKNGGKHATAGVTFRESVVLEIFEKFLDTYSSFLDYSFVSTLCICICSYVSRKSIIKYLVSCIIYEVLHRWNCSEAVTIIAFISTSGVSCWATAYSRRPYLVQGKIATTKIIQMEIKPCKDLCGNDSCVSKLLNF